MNNNNELVSGILGTTLAIIFFAGAGYSQTQPSSKATAKIGMINVMSEVSVGTNSSQELVVQAQARLNLGAVAQAGSSKARALIGNGSLSVEEVRLIKNEDLELP